MGIGVGDVPKTRDPAISPGADDPNPVGTRDQRWIDAHPTFFAAQKATLKEKFPELTDEAIDDAARDILAGVLLEKSAEAIEPRVSTLIDAWTPPKIEALKAEEPKGPALPEQSAPKAKPSQCSAKMGAVVFGIKQGEEDAKAMFAPLINACPDAEARKQLYSVAIAQAEEKGLPLETLMSLVPEGQEQEFADTCTAMNKPAPSVYEKTLVTLTVELAKDKATLDQYGITQEDLIAWRRTGIAPPGYQTLIAAYEEGGAHMLFGTAYLLKRYGEFANKERVLQGDVSVEGGKAIEKALQADEARISKTWSRVNNAAMNGVIGSADDAHKKVTTLEGELAKIDPNDPARVAKTLELEKARSDYEHKTGIASKVTESMKDVGLKQIEAAGGEEKASPDLKNATARNMGKFAVQQANIGEILFNKLTTDEKLVEGNIPFETKFAPVLVTEAQKLNPNWRQDQGMIDDASGTLGTCYGVWSQPVGRLISDATDGDKKITINATDGAALAKGRQDVRGQWTDVTKADKDLNAKQETPAQKKRYRDADTRLSQLDGEAATETALGAGAQSDVDAKEAIVDNYETTWGDFDKQADDLRAKIKDPHTSPEDKAQAEYDLATLEQGASGDVAKLGTLYKQRDELKAKLERAKSAKAQNEARKKEPKTFEPAGEPGARAAKAGQAMAQGGSDQEIANIQHDLDEVNAQLGEPEALRQRNLRAHEDAKAKVEAAGDGSPNKTEGFLIALGKNGLRQDNNGAVPAKPTSLDLMSGSYRLHNQSEAYNGEVQQTYEGTTGTEKLEGDKRQDAYLVSMQNWNDVAKAQQAKIKEANIEIATDLVSDYKSLQLLADGPFTPTEMAQEARDKMTKIKGTLWDMGLEVGGATGGRDPLTEEGMQAWQDSWGAGTIDFQVWVNKDVHANLQKRADNVDDAKAQLPEIKKTQKKEDYQQAAEDVGHMAIDVGKAGANVDKRISAHMIDDAASLQGEVKDPLAYGKEVGHAAVGILQDATNGVGGTVDDAQYMGDLRNSVEKATQLYGAEASAKELEDFDKENAFIEGLINPAIKEFQEGGDEAKAAVNGDVNEDYKGRKSLGLCAGFVFGWVGEAINSGTEKGDAAKIIDGATDGAVQDLTTFKGRYADLSKNDKLIVAATLRSDASTEEKAVALGKILGDKRLGASVAVLASGSTVMQSYQAGYVRGTDGVTHPVPGIINQAAVAIGDIDTGPLKYAKRGEAPDARKERDHQELKKTVNLNYCNDPMVQFMWSRFDDVVLFVVTGGLGTEAMEGAEAIEGLEAGIEVAKNAEKGVSWLGKITKQVGKAEAWMAKRPLLDAAVRKGGEVVFSVAHQEIMQGVGHLVHKAGAKTFGEDSFGTWLLDAGVQVGMAKMGGRPKQVDLIENVVLGGTQQGVEMFVLPRIFTNKADLEDAKFVLNQVFIAAQAGHGALKGGKERRFMEAGAKVESERFTQRANERSEQAGCAKLPPEFQTKYTQAAERYQASINANEDPRASYETFRGDVTAAAGEDPKAQAVVKGLVSVDLIASGAAAGGLDTINWAEKPPTDAELKKAIDASVDDMLKTGAAGSREEALLLAQRYCAGRIAEAAHGVEDQTVLDRLGKQSEHIGELTRVETKAPKSVVADATSSKVADGLIAGIGLTGPEADAMRSDLQKRISAFEQQPQTPESAKAYLDGLRSAFPDQPNIGNLIVQLETMRVAKNLSGERPAGNADPKDVNAYLGRLDDNMKTLGADEETRTQALSEARKTLVLERAAPALQTSDPQAQRTAIEQAAKDFGCNPKEGTAIANDAIASGTAFRLAKDGKPVTPEALEKAVLDDLTKSGLKNEEATAYLAAKKGEQKAAINEDVETPPALATPPEGYKESKTDTTKTIAWVDERVEVNPPEAKATIRKGDRIGIVFTYHLPKEMRWPFVEQAMKRMGVEAEDLPGLKKQIEGGADEFTVNLKKKGEAPKAIVNADAQTVDTHLALPQAVQDRIGDAKEAKSGEPLDAKCQVSSVAVQKRLSDNGVFAPIIQNKVKGGGNHLFLAVPGSPPKIIDPAQGQFFSGAPIEMPGGGTQYDSFAGTYDDLHARILFAASQDPPMLRHTDLASIPKDAKAREEWVTGFIEKTWGMKKPAEKNGPIPLAPSAERFDPASVVEVKTPDGYGHPGDTHAIGSDANNVAPPPPPPAEPKHNRGGKSTEAPPDWGAPQKGMDDIAKDRIQAAPAFGRAVVEKSVPAGTPPIAKSIVADEIAKAEKTEAEAYKTDPEGNITPYDVDTRTRERIVKRLRDAGVKDEVARKIAFDAVTQSHVATIAKPTREDLDAGTAYLDSLIAEQLPNGTPEEKAALRECYAKIRDPEFVQKFMSGLNDDVMKEAGGSTDPNVLNAALLKVLVRRAEAAGLPIDFTTFAGELSNKKYQEGILGGGKLQMDLSAEGQSHHALIHTIHVLMFGEIAKPLLKNGETSLDLFAKLGSQAGDHEVNIWSVLADSGGTGLSNPNNLGPMVYQIAPMAPLSLPTAETLGSMLDDAGCKTSGTTAKELLRLGQLGREGPEQQFAKVPKDRETFAELRRKAAAVLEDAGIRGAEAEMILERVFPSGLKRTKVWEKRELRLTDSLVAGKMKPEDAMRIAREIYRIDGNGSIHERLRGLAIDTADARAETIAKLTAPPANLSPTVAKKIADELFPISADAERFNLPDKEAQALAKSIRAMRKENLGPEAHMQRFHQLLIDAKVGATEMGELEARERKNLTVADAQKPAAVPQGPVEQQGWRQDAETRAKSTNPDEQLEGKVAITLGRQTDVVITGFNTAVPRGDGSNVGEIDVRTQVALVEVTAGNGANKEDQLKRYLDKDSGVNPDGLPVIVYAPNLSETRAKAWREKGIIVVRTDAELINVHRALLRGEGLMPQLTPETKPLFDAIEPQAIRLRSAIFGDTKYDADLANTIRSICAAGLGDALAQLVSLRADKATFEKALTALKKAKTKEQATAIIDYWSAKLVGNAEAAPEAKSAKNTLLEDVLPNLSSKEIPAVSAKMRDAKTPEDYEKIIDELRPRQKELGLTLPPPHAQQVMEHPELYPKEALEKINQVRASLSPEKRAELDRELEGRLFINKEAFEEGGELAYGPEALAGWKDSRNKMTQDADAGGPLTVDMICGWGGDTLRDDERGTSPYGLRVVPEEVAKLWEANPDLVVERMQASGDDVQVMVQFTRPEDVPAAFDGLVKEINAKLDAGEDPIDVAAYAQVRFNSIHPFPDGNGRASKLLSEYVLRRGGCPPAIVSSANHIIMCTPQQWTGNLREGMRSTFAITMKYAE